MAIGDSLPGGIEANIYQLNPSIQKMSRLQEQGSRTRQNSFQGLQNLLPTVHSYSYMGGTNYTSKNGDNCNITE